MHLIIYSCVVGLLEMKVHLIMEQSIPRNDVFVQKDRSLAAAKFQHVLKSVCQVA
jgi:hypothetical protein